MSRKITTVPIEHKAMAVIDNFQCEEPEIELTKNLSIRSIESLSESEQEAFSGDKHLEVNRGKRFDESEERKQTFTHITYHSATRTLERGNYVLYWYFKKRVPMPIKDQYDILRTASKEFDYVLSALRILKNMVVGIYPQENFFIDAPLPKWLNRTTTYSHDGYVLSKPNEVEPYILGSADIDTLQKLYSAIQKCTQPGILTALSRLDTQYTRANEADKIIDAVIALEALYTRGTTTEISLRVGLRSSLLLGNNDPDQREYYFNLFNLAYNLRSQLVHGVIHHGGDILKLIKKKGWQSNEEFMLALDDMLRKSLYQILLNTENKKLEQSLHTPLDTAIRRGEPFSW